MLTTRRRAVLARIPGLSLGLVMFGGGIGLNIRANLGLSPWDSFHQGIAHRTPISVGLVTILVSAVVLLGWIPLRQRPGLGTIMNASLVGVMIDVTLLVVPEPEHLLVRSLFLASGTGMVAFGSGLYIGSRLGPGPRDGIMTGLAARGMSIRLARTLIEGTVLIAGWLLGGAIGIGTVIYTISIGPLLQFFLRWTDRGPL